MYYIYLSNSSSKNFKLFIILLITLIQGFFTFPWVLINFLLIKFFFQNIRRYFSDISVKSSYRYICDYQYFHHWERTIHTSRMDSISSRCTPTLPIRISDSIEITSNHPRNRKRVSVSTQSNLLSSLLHLAYMNDAQKIEHTLKLGLLVFQFLNIFIINL